MERLRILREEKGLSLDELAEKLNINKSTLSRIETDQREPKESFIKECAAFFDVSTDFLLERTNQRNGTSLSKTTLEDPNLNVRDKRDIAKDLELLISDLDDETAGPLFYGGELPEEDKEILKGILEQALVVAKIKNKAKYTPKKYRASEEN